MITSLFYKKHKIKNRDNLYNIINYINSIKFEINNNLLNYLKKKNIYFIKNFDNKFKKKFYKIL